MAGFKKLHPLPGEINKYILASGYRQATQMQERLIPLLLSGRDIAVESGEQRGKSLCIAIPLLLKIKKAHRGIKALIITESGDMAAKVIDGIRRLSQIKTNKPDVIAVGFSDLIKKEGRQLRNNPDIVIGSAARIIDHIRRDHVDFTHMELVFIDETKEKRQEFLNDIFFIFSKLPPQKQTIYFSYSIEDNENKILSLLKRPVLVQKSDFLLDNPSLKHSFLVTENRLELLKALIIARQMDALLIIGDSLYDCRKIEKELNHFQLKASFITKSLPEEKVSKILDSFNAGKKSILIVNFSEIKILSPEGIYYVIFYNLPLQPGEYTEICKPQIIGNNCKEIINLVSEKQIKEIAKIEEIGNMKMQQQEIPNDKEIVKGFLANTIKKIKEEENPVELDYYKKLIRKNVSFFDRSYLAAYLIRNALKRVSVKKANQTTLFISAGKSKGIFRQDLVRLFTEALQLNETDIGEIKILGNYSFIDIPAQYALKAINLLNNSDFKGRKITVNFSRKRTERKPVRSHRSKQFR